MSSQPLVSIVIPAYNAGAVLADALRSVKVQTYPRWEALVVDDGSTDGTAALARGFADGDPRFQLISQPRGGVSSARNAALRRARGELIAFLDADDTWLPEKLTRQVGLFDGVNGVDFGFANYWFWDGSATLGTRYTKRHRFPEGNPFDALVWANVYGTSTVVVTREALARIGEFDPGLTIGEDWDLWLRLAEAGVRAGGIWEPLARYRFWPHNTTRLKLSIIEANVLVLEHRSRACSNRRARRLYQRSLAVAHANREVARAVNRSPASANGLTSALWRAWRLNPHRLKWLLWWAGLLVPPWLGGRPPAQAVRRRIRAKWGDGAAD